MFVVVYSSPTVTSRTQDAGVVARLKCLKESTVDEQPKGKEGTYNLIRSRRRNVVYKHGPRGTCDQPRSSLPTRWHRATLGDTAPSGDEEAAQKGNRTTKPSLREKGNSSRNERANGHWDRHKS